MRALEKARSVSGGLPFLHEVQRNNARIVIEPIADYVDPPASTRWSGRPSCTMLITSARFTTAKPHASAGQSLTPHRRGHPRGDLYRQEPPPHGPATSSAGLLACTEEEMIPPAEFASRLADGNAQKNPNGFRQSLKSLGFYVFSGSPCRKCRQSGTMQGNGRRVGQVFNLSQERQAGSLSHKRAGRRLWHGSVMSARFLKCLGA